jgi:hypothetical protein
LFNAHRGYKVSCGLCRPYPPRLKLVGLDSSLTARKQLASELHYAGDTSDSASMNIWLHKQMMAKIAANGGKLPADLTY